MGQNNGTNTYSDNHETVIVFDRPPTAEELLALWSSNEVPANTGTAAEQSQPAAGSYGLEVPAMPDGVTCFDDGLITGSIDFSGGNTVITGGNYHGSNPCQR